MMHDGVCVAKEDHLYKYLDVNLHPYRYMVMTNVWVDVFDGCFVDEDL